MRFGQAKGAQHLATRQRHQPLLFLRLGGIAQQNGVDRAVGDTDGGAGAAVAGSDFFQHQRERQVIQVGAAVGFWHANAVCPQCRKATVRVFGEMMLFVPARGMGPELLLREVTHRVADHFLVLGQQHGQARPAAPRRAVTSISIFIRGSISPTTMAVAAGRARAKYWPKTGATWSNKLASVNR